MKRSITLLLLLSMLMTASCGSSDVPTDTTSASTDTTTEAPKEFVYEFNGNFGGEEFNILNAGDIYSMHAEIDREEITGESLDDAMYERCRTLEEKLNIVVKEDTKGVDSELASYAMQLIMAGDNVYDTMYIPTRDLYKFVSGGYLYNLLEVDGFNFDGEWWLQSYNKANSIGGKLYAAAGYSQLMVVDSLCAIFFNEDMMEDLKLEKPYDLVRQGKWTIDKLGEYLKAGARLNGDTSFAWSDTGSAIYGMSGTGLSKFMIASDELILKSEDGKLTLNVGDEKYYGVIEKLVSTLGIGMEDGRVAIGVAGRSDDQIGNYLNNFEVQRSLFVTAEISKTARMRDKEFSFGVVPFPKYDEDQENYYSAPFYGTPCFAIPVTNTDPESTAVIGDALTYLSYTDVLPTFREITLEQKGLRNDDSIEMLDIVITSAIPDLVLTYNIGTALRTAVETKIKGGDSAVASIFASYESELKAAIDEINNTGW
ncbi:MAG: hypothetical protein IJ493_00260 [Clostridia bacterium]|nr:hypothetical protein [Clostridia bacterium]